MESYYSTKNIFNLIVKWKYHLLGLILISGILSVVFSSDSFITPKYESNAILYPASTTGTLDSEAEQMLEILTSSDIMFKVIEAFNLPEHYGIKENEKNYLHKIIKAYKNNVKFNKTANQAVEITVRDKAPLIASNIIDSLIVFYNRKLLNLKKEKSKELVYIFKDHLNKKQKEIDSLAKELTNIRKEYGILHMSSQVEKITEAIYMGRSSKEASEILDGWKEKGAEYHRTDSLFSYAIADYQEIKTSYEYAVRDTRKFQTYTHVVSYPFPSDKKAYPKRWIICLFSVLGALFTGLIVVSIIDSQKVKK